MKNAALIPAGLHAMYRRTWVYIQPPWAYEIAGCPSCLDSLITEWSEWRGHLWCPACKIDFIPAHNGLFDGPISIKACEMLGISFERVPVKQTPRKRKAK